MAKKTKANKLLVIVMALVLFSMILATLATLARADTPAIPALTKRAVFAIGSRTVQVDGGVSGGDAGRGALPCAW